MNSIPKEASVSFRGSMVDGSVRKLTDWERKRKLTSIAFVVESLFLGMEYSVTFLTLWMYIEEMVQPDHPKLYYSLISASYLMAAVIFSVIVGRMVDKHRNIRTTFFWGNVLVIIGNVIYALPWSPWLLIAGRFISGGGGPLRSVIAGELARCYPREELIAKYSSVGMAFNLGFIIGPGFNFAFESINFYIGDLHITYVNVPGLYMAVLFIFVQIMCFFMVFDLSKEYDMKADNIHTTPREKLDKLAQEKLASAEGSLNTSSRTYASHDVTNVYFGTSVSLTIHSNEYEPLLGGNDGTDDNACSILGKMMSKFDTAMMIICSYFTTFFIVCYNMWLPLLVIDTLGWTITEMNGIVFGAGTLCALMLAVLSWKPLSEGATYYLSIFSTFGLALLSGVFICLSWKHDNVTMNICLFVLYGCSFAFVSVMEEIFMIGCMAKMVSSRIQTFSESIRLSMSRLGALTALLTSPILYEYIHIVGYVNIGLIAIAFVMFLSRAKMLKSPRTIIF